MSKELHEKKIHRVWNKKSFAAALCTVGFAGLAALGGCAKDQTLEEYHNRRLGEQTARLQAISGTYRGELVNQDDKSSMGAFQVRLEPSLTTVNSGDSTTTTGLAILTGKASLMNTGLQASAALQKISFTSPDNSSSGALSATLMVPTTAGTSVEMSFSGTIANGRLDGVLQPTTRTGLNARFSLIKDGPLARIQAVNGPRQALSPGSRQTFQGSYDDPECLKASSNPTVVGPSSRTRAGRLASEPVRKAGECKTLVRMELYSEAASAEENFLNAFLDQKTVKVILGFSDGNQLIGSQAFNNVTLDTTQGRFNTGNGNATTSLFCGRTPDISGPNWSCRYANGSTGMPQNFILEPVAN